MITIYKYPLKFQQEQTIEIPSEYELLTVQLQDNTPCLWAMVDTKEPLISAKVFCIGTGHPIDDEIYGFKYISTIQTTGIAGEPLVFHYFFQGIGR